MGYSESFREQAAALARRQGGQRLEITPTENGL